MPAFTQESWALGITSYSISCFRRTEQDEGRRARRRSRFSRGMPPYIRVTYHISNIHIAPHQMATGLSFILQPWVVARRNPQIRVHAEVSQQSTAASRLEVSPASIGISLKAMECGKSSLHDFCKSHFLFHGLNPYNPEHLFQYLPLFMFIESYIYQVDQMFEENLSKTVAENGIVSFTTIGDPLAVVREELMKRGLLTQRISKELLNGVQYWKMEQSLCLKLLNPSPETSISDVLHTQKIRSFDYRLLNLLLYELRGQEVNDTHLEFLDASNYVVEILDDMCDYEEDVMDNTFNIVRMFSRVYGTEAPKMLENHIHEAKAKYERLLMDLEADIRETFPARELTIKEEKNISEIWKIPDIIIDEAAYRLEHSAQKD